MRYYAVLTGDLLPSGIATQAACDTALASLETAAANVAAWGGSIAVGYARSGGPGWRLSLDRPRLAFRTVLYCQAVLRRQGARLSSRIAVADGAGELPASGNPNEGFGAAFAASAELLARMRGYRRLGHAAGGAEAAVYHLADAITRDWTQAQARALCEMLPPLGATQAQAAARLGVTRTAVQQALAAADFPALTLALDALETPN